MYRAFAPFFEGVRGDRRVTGTAQGSAAVSAASVGWWHMMDGVTMLRKARGHLAGEFSRESGGGEALRLPNIYLRH